MITPSVFAVAAIPIGLAVGGAILTAALVRRLANSLEARNRKVFEETLRTLPRFSTDVLRPPSLVEEDARSNMKAAFSHIESLRLPPADAMRVSALLSLASAPYVIESPVMLEEPLKGLFSAKTLAETSEARKALTDVVRANHKEVFTRGLIKACTNAVRKIGFATVETSTGPLGEVRFIATDADGRSLVTEIQHRKNGDPSLAAEVVGVQDGSCHQILDAFEKALAEQRVQYVAPRRKPTGGVCQLEAAREFVKRRVARHSSTITTSVIDGHDAQRRAQRLNQRQGQKAR